MAPPEVAATLPRVLIVDDSRMVRASIIKHIKGAFEIREAADGEEGWQMMMVDPAIRVVVSDLTMPKLDGYGLLERVRTSKLARIRNMPVIMISGDEDEKQRKRAAKLGANDFITKGIGAAEILSRLDTLTRLSQVEEELDASRVAVMEQATTDPLTKLATIGFLVKQGSSLWSYARRHQTPLAIVRVKLDDFDALRAKTGEAVADQILVAVAKLIASRTRREDCVARISEDEFAIASPSTPRNSAVVFAQRMIEELRAAKITWQGNQLKMSACAGLSDSSLDASESFADLLSLAQKRLGEARDRESGTVVAEDAVRVDASSPPARPAAPSVEDALTMLAAGRGIELKPFVSELARKVYPLVKFCDEMFEESSPATAQSTNAAELLMMKTQPLTALKPLTPK